MSLGVVIKGEKDSVGYIYIGGRSLGSLVGSPGCPQPCQCIWNGLVVLLGLPTLTIPAP